MVQAGPWPGVRAARSKDRPYVLRTAPPASPPRCEGGPYLTAKILTLQRRWRRFPVRRTRNDLSDVQVTAYSMHHDRPFRLIVTGHSGSS